MKATSTASACPLSTNGPEKDPGPLDSIDSTEAPRAAAIEYPLARRKTLVSGSSTLTLSANALRSPSMISA
jgi:hypothetical protein